MLVNGVKQIKEQRVCIESNKQQASNMLKM